ncbi:MAG: tyrosine-type recombinase/integrase [Bacteroidetes bacterium]|nr:tyrosine-type recombinase/integrase [Bacteroidota bacterium]
MFLDEQEKTNSNVYTPLLPPAVAILKKYSKEQEDTGYIIPKLSQQKLNVYLKTLSDACGLNKHITHRVARHTFATTVCGRNGVPRHLISAWIGHKPKQTPTDIYAQPTREESLKFYNVLYEEYKNPDFIPN